MFGLGIALLWLSYHATPWLAMATDGWSSFLLQPEFIPDALRFATLCMYAYLVGFWLTERWPRRSPTGVGQRALGRLGRSEVATLGEGRSGCAGGHARARRVRLTGSKRWIPAHRPWELPELSMLPLLIAAFVVVALNVMLVGGLEEFLWSSRDRGAGQFDERVTVGDRLSQIGGVAVGVAGPAIAVSCALAAIQRINARKYAQTAGFVAILMIANLPHIWGFSRGAGFVLIFCGLAGVVFVQRFKVIWVFLFIALGVWFSFTGYTQRGEFRPGLANFLVALATQPAPWFTPSHINATFDPNVNPLNAVDAWTAAVWSGPSAVPSELFDKLVLLVQLLQPLPSEFVSERTKVSLDLADVFGTWGSTGLTTPALAELYLLFGSAGALVLLGVGAIAARVDQASRSSRSWLVPLSYTAIAFAFVIQAHSGLRAATRPIVYVSVLLGLRLLVGILSRGRTRERRRFDRAVLALDASGVQRAR